MEHALRVVTDIKDFDLDFVFREIQNSYWATCRTQEANLLAIKNSLCFGLFLETKQIGFARVVTDFATITYLCDVIITKEEQGKGYGKYLMESVFAHKELQSVRWILRTKDAHSLYERFGFQTTWRPERYMEREAFEQDKGAAKPFGMS